MDWKRAKTTLIIIFILLNAVLAGILYKDVRAEQVSQRTIENTRLILDQNNIHIECPIPKETGADYILKNEEQPLDKKAIASALLGDNYMKTGDNTYEYGTKKLIFSTGSGFEYTDPDAGQKIYTNTKEGIDVYLKNLADKIEIPFDEFRQDGYKNDKEVRATYKGYYKGYNVFDNYIDVIVRNSGIETIRYQYKKPMSITPRDINIIPAYEILITKVTQKPGITIQDVDIGFKGYTNVGEETKTLYEGLAWRIKTSEGTELYYNARNGEEIG